MGPYAFSLPFPPSHSRSGRFPSFTFKLAFELFLKKNLSSQFSQSGFPPLHHCSDSPQPAAFVHRYATHGQMTLLTKCVCASVWETKERSYAGIALCGVYQISVVAAVFLHLLELLIFHILSVNTVRRTHGKLDRGWFLAVSVRPSSVSWHCWAFSLRLCVLLQRLMTTPR